MSHHCPCLSQVSENQFLTAPDVFAIWFILLIIANNNELKGREWSKAWHGFLKLPTLTRPFCVNGMTIFWTPEDVKNK